MANRPMSSGESMKNFFGIDCTEGSEPVGSAFTVYKNPSGNDAEWETFESDYVQNEKKKDLPLPLEIIKFLCLIGWVTALCAFVKADEAGALLHRSPWLLWMLTVCFALWLALSVCGKMRAKRTSPEQAELNRRADALLRETRETLGIPETAIDLDVLGERFVMKDGVPKHKSLDGFNDYLNLDMWAFVRDGSLFLANTEQVWEIPLTSLRGTVRLKKRLGFAGWNKSTPYNEKPYKRFRITVNQFGTYFAHCVQVQIADARGCFFLLLPEYEAEPFSALTAQ